MQLTRGCKVSTPRFSHISPLHHQAIRGRDIVLTENPQLHLVYYYDKIFIKPIPRYLLSYAFWQYLGNQSNALREAAIGFMRTYSYLVQYESDFILAQSKGLLPRNDIITFESFARFVNAFDGFTDEDVCPRYSYGELRLTRLNFYTRILLRKLAFHPVNVQWGTVLNGFVTPLITIFAIASVVLNAMQVYLAVSNLSVVSENAALVGASQWFSVVVLIFSAALTGILLCLITFFFFHGIWFARSILYKKKKDVGGDKWKNKKSVVV